MDFENLCRELQSASQLSHAQLECLISILHNQKQRFAPQRAAKYGTLDIAFSDEELRIFLAHVHDRKFELLFKCQAYMGLRIGEAVAIKIDDINFQSRELMLLSEKTRVYDTLRIPVGLSQELRAWILAHSDQIMASGGYLFYKNNDNNRNFEQHVDKNYARKVFRKARACAGLVETYGISDETKFDHASRPLYRLGTHSLRRYAGTKFHTVSRDVVLTSRYLRHRNIKETIKYIRNNKQQLYHDTDNAFDERQRLLISNK